MEFAQSTMTEVFLRFPHLSEDIFNALDNKTFTICKEVSKVWDNYLNDQKFVQERRVRMIKKMIKKFQPDFQQNLEVVQANVSLAQLPDDLGIREPNWCKSVDKASLHKQFSSAFDKAKVQTILHEARYGNFDEVDKMILVEFKRVYSSWSQSSMIIYRLATRSKHEEVMNYLRLKYRFVKYEEYEKSLMIP